MVHPTKNTLLELPAPLSAAALGIRRQPSLYALACGALFLGLLASCGTDSQSPSSPSGSGGAAASSGSGGGDAGASSSGTASGGGASASTGSPAAGSTSAGGGSPPDGSTSSDAGAGGSTPAAPGVEIAGRQILVDGAPFHIQGVCWNPVPRGGTHPANLDYAGAASVDIPLMANAGINAVRTYEPLTDRGVLDALYAAGIRVLNTVYPYGANAPSSAADLAASVKDHPAILMWVIGNEWNYNGLYVNLPHDEALARVKEVSAAIRSVDTTHPISTVYGELPSPETIAALPDIDVWGLNIYRGLSFGNVFADWAARSEKPFYIAEYGADAWNANTGAEDVESQAEAVGALTQLIWDNGSAHAAQGTCAGGTVFEWADEWWKDSSGAADVHDVGGIAPGGGPHPDQTFNEEWWGIVDIDRVPRPAYNELARIFTR